MCRRSRSGGRARNCSACASRNKVRAPIKVSNFVQIRGSNKRIGQKNTSTIRVTDVQNARIARAGRIPRQTYVQTKNDSETSDRRTYDTNDIARREGTRSQTYVRSYVAAAGHRAGRGKNSPTHPRCGIDHWWRASEYLQNRSRRTAGLIRRALELIPTTPILKRTSFDATEATRWPRVPRENSNVRDLNFRKRKIRRVYEIRAIIKRQS